MAANSSGGVQELKFPLSREAAGAVLEWMRSSLQPDPHGCGPDRDSYIVQSVYLDTPEFDVFHRRGSFARAKYRIRRYGDDMAVFLERKLKRGGVVRKRRAPVVPEELERLRAQANGAVWEGSWFHHRLALRRLRPVVQMSYRRVARWADGAEGPYRVTLDADLRARAVDGFVLPCVLDGEDLLKGGSVLEVKFAEQLPASLRRLAEDLQLATGAFSKYRAGVRWCGLVSETTAEPGSGASPAHALV